MIGDKMRKKMNEQIKHELDSAYLYRAMAAYFHSVDWNGMASWMLHQADEEEEHAMKFFHHIIEREGRVELLGLKEPNLSWDNSLGAWKDALAHEKFITGRINELMKLAVEEKDYPAIILLKWFIDEQVEEERSVHEVVKILDRINRDPGAMYELDNRLAKR